MPVPQEFNFLFCGVGILPAHSRKRQDACSTRDELSFLWGGHPARP
ncbi:hypothetical protein QT987_24415 [Microcoleus sp. SVA1B4]